MPLRYRLFFLEAVFVRYLNMYKYVSHHKCNNLVILSWANETLFLFKILKNDAYSFLLTTTQKNRVIFN